MAERKTDSAEQIVDEMKRKARRRLVGAVVLALAAIIVLPLLLEKEPRPLGDDVSVQIPPVDEGKFINRLTGKAPEKALPKAESKAITTAPATSEAKPEPRAGAVPAPVAGSTPPSATGTTAPPSATPSSSPPGAKGEPPAANAAPTPSPAVKAAAPVEPGTEAKSAPVADAKSAPTVPVSAEAPAVAPSAAPTGAPAAAVLNADGFVVQLAAFADDKGANALANKLKKNGYAAYVQSVETSRGTLWRVRVGGYATRQQADAARLALKSEGYNGITASAQ